MRDRARWRSSPGGIQERAKEPTESGARQRRHGQHARPFAAVLLQNVLISILILQQDFARIVRRTLIDDDDFDLGVRCASAPSSASLSKHP